LRRKPVCGANWVYWLLIRSSRHIAFIPEAAKMIRQKTADQRRQTEKKLIAFKPEAAMVVSISYIAGSLSSENFGF
jgi:hypothetical protein